MAQTVQPEKADFKDDGSIPNSELPLLVYRQAFALGSSDLAAHDRGVFCQKRLDRIVACGGVSLSSLSQHNA